MAHSGVRVSVRVRVRLAAVALGPLRLDPNALLRILERGVRVALSARSTKRGERRRARPVRGARGEKGERAQGARRVVTLQ